MSAVNDRARKVLPGGVNSPVRAMRQIGREPIFIERGEGAELVDVEGNRYIDWVCSWGPLILGHADPAVVSAVIEAAKRGTSYGAATAIEVRLAEEVVDRFPSIEMVRMTSSGTEAAMNSGSRPIDPIARTGELTPPGSTCKASSYSAAERAAAGAAPVVIEYRSLRRRRARAPRHDARR